MEGDKKMTWLPNCDPQDTTYDHGEDEEWFYASQRVSTNEILKEFITAVMLRFYNEHPTQSRYVFAGLADHNTTNSTEFLTGVDWIKVLFPPGGGGPGGPGNTRQTFTLPYSISKYNSSTGYIYIIFKYYNFHIKGEPYFLPVGSYPNSACPGVGFLYFHDTNQWYMLDNGCDFSYAVESKNCSDFSPPCPQGCYEWSDGTCKDYEEPPPGHVYGTIISETYYTGSFARGTTAHVADVVVKNTGDIFGSIFVKFGYKDTNNQWQYWPTSLHSLYPNATTTLNVNLDLFSYIQLGNVQFGVKVWGQDESEPSLP